MQQNSVHFKSNARSALLDDSLKSALGNVKTGFIAKRLAAVQLVPEWEQIRSEAKSLKNHVLENLDHYLLAYEASVQRNGGSVHWAASSEEASELIVQICREAGAKTVTKGKSMVGEEAKLNEALAEAGIEPIETDLGEYIIQFAPAIHKTKEQVSDLFLEHHAQYGLDTRLVDRTELVNEARTVLREKFRAADVGITGANFLIAETGQHVLVTNEGNGESGGCEQSIEIVGAQRYGPAFFQLHQPDEWAKAWRRHRWTRGLSCRACRQPSNRNAGWRAS